MSTAAAFPSMGATLFFGMTFVVLITQGEPETQYANPQKTMAQTDLPATPSEFVRTAQASWPAPFRLPDAILDRRRANAPEQLENTDFAWQRITATQPAPTVRQEIVKPRLNASDTQAPEALAVDARRERRSIKSFPREALRDTQVQMSDPELRLPPVLLSVQRIARPPITPHLEVATGQPQNWRRSVYASKRPSESTEELRPRIATSSANRSNPQSNVAPLIASEEDAALSLAAPLVVRLSRNSSPPALQANFGQARQPRIPQSARPARVAGDSVFLRVAPQANARVLGQFDTDTLAILREIRGDWRRVSIEDQTGWMFFRYLEPSSFE